MKKSTIMKIVFVLLLVAVAVDAGGSGTLFQNAWTRINQIIGDTFLGYIVAAFMIIKAISVFFNEGGNWTKILTYMAAAGFVAVIAPLAQSISGAVL